MNTTLEEVIKAKQLLEDNGYIVMPGVNITTHAPEFCFKRIEETK